jgi:hypothetical protein
MLESRDKAACMILDPSEVPSPAKVFLAFSYNSSCGLPASFGIILLIGAFASAP